MVWLDASLSMLAPDERPTFERAKAGSAPPRDVAGDRVGLTAFAPQRKPSPLTIDAGVRWCSITQPDQNSVLAGSLARVRQNRSPAAEKGADRALTLMRRVGARRVGRQSSPDVRRRPGISLSTPGSGTIKAR
jgi:hypothetical protein